MWKFHTPGGARWSCMRTGSFILHVELGGAACGSFILQVELGGATCVLEVPYSKWS